jgi:hypothetical protein
MGAVSLSTGQRAWGQRAWERRAYKSRPYHILLPRHHVGHRESRPYHILLPRHHVGHRYYIGHYTVGSQTNLARIVLRPTPHHATIPATFHPGIASPSPMTHSPMMLGAVSKPVVPIRRIPIPDNPFAYVIGARFISPSPPCPLPPHPLLTIPSSPCPSLYLYHTPSNRAAEYGSRVTNCL